MGTVSNKCPSTNSVLVSVSGCVFDSPGDSFATLKPFSFFWKGEANLVCPQQLSLPYLILGNGCFGGVGN